MKKVFLSLILSVLFCGFGFAQHNLNGKVFNTRTGETLAGANIKITELNVGTTTNVDGEYSFSNISEGNYTIEVSFVGFKTKQSKIKLSKDTKKNFNLAPTAIELKESVVTATRTRLNKKDVPAKTDIISKEQIEKYPATSPDDIFRIIPNLVVNRSWGVFSKNSSVTMRGMDASARTLVMMNGTPMNKTAGGSIIWDMVNPESIESIEIVKGPGSAVYGNNAMGGVINIMTKTPDTKEVSGSVSSYVGLHSYKGANLNLGQRTNIGKKSWFWQINSTYSKGDGYIIDPDEENDYRTNAYVDEFTMNLKSGIDFNANNQLTFEYSYYNGKHGAGEQILQEDGLKDHYFTNLLSARYIGNWNGYEINANVFNQWQDYNTEDESWGKKGYKLDKNFTNTNDYGLFLNINKTFGKHRLLWGIDIKNGSLSGDNRFLNEDLEQKDIIERDGKIFFYGLYLQDELEIIEDKFIATVGFRLDFAKFSDASMNIIDPTNFTGFDDDEYRKYEDKDWNKFSPRVNLLWKLNQNNSIYASYSTGFMPPKLDDMVSSRVVTKGYKEANPDLKPETITNYELGGTFKLCDKFTFDPAIYYSLADDMVYFIDTGDEVEIGGKNKPVLQKQNISKAEIYGFEASLQFKASKKLNFVGSYTLNHSTIKEFYDDATATDYEGKYLIEVPKHQYSLAAFWRSKDFGFSAVYNYMDKQWFDDENTEYIESYHIVDIKASIFFTEKIIASWTVQNLFDKEFIDRKGLLGPGRFLLFELKYKI